MTERQRTRRQSIWAGSLLALLFYGLLLIGPAIGGMITGDLWQNQITQNSTPR